MSSGTPSPAMTVLADDVDDPVVPMMWEVLVGGIGLALLLSMVVGLISVLGARIVSPQARAVWAVVVIAFPLVGSTAWFIWRSRQTAPR